MLNYPKMLVFFSEFTKPGLFQARTFVHEKKTKLRKNREFDRNGCHHEPLKAVQNSLP